MTGRRYTLDPSVWRSPDGGTLIGGSDFTIVGLDRDQIAALDRLLDGGADEGLSDFAEWCLSRNLIQPEIPEAGSASIAVDGKMVDYAVARVAREVIARAELAERAAKRSAQHS